MSIRARVLIVDDDKSFASIIRMSLKSDNVDSTIAHSPSEALQIYKTEKMNFDLVMLDYKFENSELTGADLAVHIRKLNPHQSILFMTGYDEKEIYLNLLNTGVSRHFLQKGQSCEAMVSVIKKSLIESGVSFTEANKDTLEDAHKRESAIRALGMVGRSKELFEITQLVEKYRKFKSCFLIIGDSGSGKELIAKAFQIPGKPFFAIDCARYSSGNEQFLESELYGHVKGAFTGADTEKKGAFEVANSGVIFLDELHCLSIAAQAKLLRTIQEMKIRKLGDTTGKETSVSVTIVAATRPLIKSMIQNGEFKDDLYFRLSKSVIEVPSLSERALDIKPLARFFLEKYNNKHDRNCELHPVLLRELESYNWPANVRELEGFIENSIMTARDESTIGPEIFRQYLEKKLMGEKSERDCSPKADLKLVVDSVQSEQIIGALKESSTVQEAADKLAVPRTTLIHRIKKLNINSNQYLSKRG